MLSWFFELLFEFFGFGLFKYKIVSRKLDCEVVFDYEEEDEIVNGVFKVLLLRLLGL